MGIDPTAFIHPKAHVEDSTVGARTRIWQFASVIRGTVLGEDCNVASCATLDGPILGDRCIVSPNVDMGPSFLIGNDVFIGPSVVLCNDRWPRVSKEGFDMEALRKQYSIIVEDGASIGAHAVVLPGVIIGKGAMIAAGAVVNHSVPANHLFLKDGKMGEIGSDRELIRVMRAGRC